MPILLRSSRSWNLLSRPWIPWKTTTTKLLHKIRNLAGHVFIAVVVGAVVLMFGWLLALGVSAGVFLLTYPIEWWWKRHHRVYAQATGTITVSGIAVGTVHQRRLHRLWKRIVGRD